MEIGALDAWIMDVVCPRIIMIMTLQTIYQMETMQEVRY